MLISQLLENPIIFALTLKNVRAVFLIGNVILDIEILGHIYKKVPTIFIQNFKR